MISPIELGREFFEMLVQIDEAIVERAAAKVCEGCGGPLYPWCPETHPAVIFARSRVYGQAGNGSVRRAFYGRVNAPSDGPVSHRDGCVRNQRADGP
jgi:hypothetical protein